MIGIQSSHVFTTLLIGKKPHVSIEHLLLVAGISIVADQVLTKRHLKHLYSIFVDFIPLFPHLAKPVAVVLEVVLQVFCSEFAQYVSC